MTQEHLMGRALPPLPLDEWEDTKETLHRYCQIVGKVRMEYSPYRNHWWHVTLYATTRGLTTGPIPYGRTPFELSFDLLENRLAVTTGEGAFSFALDDLPVAEFYRRLFEGLRSLEIDASINPVPFRLDDEHTLDANTYNRTCDEGYVRRYHHVLAWIDQVFKEFAGRFNGKTSLVQLYWHSFDLAVTRFSGRRAPVRPGADLVTRERARLTLTRSSPADSVWPGDPSFREPALYSYTAPERENLAEQPLHPPAASWQEGGTALLTYEEVRTSSSPRETLLEFLPSAYEAGAKTAGWAMEEFRAGDAV